MKEPKKIKLTDNPSIKEPQKTRLEPIQLLLFDDYGPVLSIEDTKFFEQNENSEKST
jgi:hypothetical protein